MFADEEDLAYGIGSDDSDVDKCHQLDVLHTSSTTKTTTFKRKNSKKAASKMSNKTPAAKAIKQATEKKTGKKTRKPAAKKQVVRKKKETKQKTMDDYCKNVEDNTCNMDKSDEESQSSTNERLEERRETSSSLPYAFTSSQSSVDNVDDNDSDHDKDMMLAQLYVDNSIRNDKLRKDRSKLIEKKVPAMKELKKDANHNPIILTSDDGDGSAWSLSCGNPLLKLKQNREQQGIKNDIEDCFGFNDCEDNEDAIVRVLPAKEPNILSNRDAVVVNINNEEIIDLSSQSSAEKMEASPSSVSPISTRRKSKRLQANDGVSVKGNSDTAAKSSPKHQQTRKTRNAKAKAKEKTEPPPFITPEIPQSTMSNILQQSNSGSGRPKRNAKVGYCLVTYIIEINMNLEV